MWLFAVLRNRRKFFYRNMGQKVEYSSCERELHSCVEETFIGVFEIKSMMKNTNDHEIT